MANFYTYKLYNRLWESESQVDNKTLVNVFNFTEKNGWWQGRLTIELALQDINAIIWDFIQIRLFNEDNKWLWKALYSWVIRDITQSEDISKFSITIWALGMLDLFNDFEYWSSWTFNATPWNILVTLFNAFNNRYWNITKTMNLWTSIFDTSWIETSGSSIEIEYNEWDTYYQILKRVLSSSSIYSFFVDSTWKVNFRLKANITPKTLLLASNGDIDSITRKKTADDIANKITVSNGTSEVTVEDLPSQSIYWVRFLRIEDSDIVDLQARADSELADRKTPKEEISLDINPGFTQNLNPWDIINTNGSIENIENQVIAQISRTNQQIQIKVDRFKTVWDIIVN